MAANYQKERTYWARISVKFHSLVGKPEIYRNPDSLNSKFRKVRAAVQSFNQVYTRMGHSSGSNDEDKLTRALGEYHITNSPFPYMEEWNLLRQSSKFHLVANWDPTKTRGQPSAKRSKTTSGSTNEPSDGSDARVNFDLNETPVFDLETEEPRYQRAGGRDAAKKAAHAGSSGTMVLTDEFDTLKEKLDGLMDQGRQRLVVEERKATAIERKGAAIEHKQFNKDMRLLTVNTSGLPAADRMALEEAKRQIRIRYGLGI